MEQTLGLWIAPLLLIPGMALLAISTAGRYTQVLLFLAAHPEHEQLKRQLPLLQYSLIALYAGILFDALAALLGGLSAFNPIFSQALIIVLSCIGVVCLVVAAVCLIVDTARNPLRGVHDA